MSISKCKGCGADIIWTRTEQGRPMPVHAEPAEDGNVTLYDRPNGIISSVLSPIETHLAALGGVVLYKAHFAECLYADQFRKPRGKAT